MMISGAKHPGTRQEPAHCASHLVDCGFPLVCSGHTFGLQHRIHAGLARPSEGMMPHNQEMGRAALETSAG